MFHSKHNKRFTDSGNDSLHGIIRQKVAYSSLCAILRSARAPHHARETASVRLINAMIKNGCHRTSTAASFWYTNLNGKVKVIGC